MNKLFERGFAIGTSDIRNDCFHFRYENEFFVVKDRSIKTRRVMGCLVARISEVRRLADGR